jgi:hypothetical protein
VRAFTFFVSRDIFLEAVFLWMTPFDAALFKALIAWRSALPESSLLPEVTAASTFFTTVLTLLKTALLRRLRFTLCLALFMAERFFLGLALGGNSNLLIICWKN